jgi:pimeloyl-ACP methyl ester carboxylesterase
MMKTILLLCASALYVLAQSPRAITVTSPAKVDSTRAALVQHIWGTSWETVTAKQPRLVDHRYKPQTDDALPASISNLESIDRLDVGGTVASTAFILYPSRPNLHKVVIVHHGHGCDLLDHGDHPVHLEFAIRKLVAAGYTVAAMRMPLYQSPAHCGASRAHDKLFVLHPKTGTAIQFFMEPIARTVNYLLAHHSELHEVDMIGLSGGGWTTTVYAAIDPRIVKSIPVAGTLPLYLRGDHYNHDLEQYVPELYRVAGYKDLYVLGAVGTGRLQLQILNRYDDCCFGEKQHTVGGPPYTQAIRQYQRDVQNTLAHLKSGTFALHLDQSAHYHQISTEAIEKVILPVLGGAAPPAT